MNRYEEPIVTEGDFNRSTKKRLPICFCLDVSGSMVSLMENGQPRIEELNRTFQNFIETMKMDDVVAQSADIAVVTFGGNVEILSPFAPLDRQRISRINVNSRSFTPMGEGIITSLKLLDARKEAYKRKGLKYYQPWLVVLTDGEPEGPNAQINFEEALSAVNQLENSGKIVVFNIALGNDVNFYNIGRLSTAHSEPIYANNASDLKKFFKFLGSTLGTVSRGQIRDGEIPTRPEDLPRGERMDISEFLNN